MDQHVKLKLAGLLLAAVMAMPLGAVADDAGTHRPASPAPKVASDQSKPDAAKSGSARSRGHRRSAHKKRHAGAKSKAARKAARAPRAGGDGSASRP